MVRVELQRLRSGLLVHLNRCYPHHMDLPQIHTHENEHGSKRLRRELEYLVELGFVKAAKRNRWRITALGRDFLLGLVEANGLMEPTLLPDIGE
jgi:hypothetical protein